MPVEAMFREHLRVPKRQLIMAKNGLLPTSEAVLWAGNARTCIAGSGTTQSCRIYVRIKFAEKTEVGKIKIQKNANKNI
jgi:hypothetical protein